MTDLVKQLRKWRDAWVGFQTSRDQCVNEEAMGWDCGLAADEIVRLREEIGRLRNELRVNKERFAYIRSLTE